ncbi:polysaccharide biosynthesis/export family protein [Thermogutta sp.]|uniref:polysaccharide biosynthesis/export family protein n=1 Tax=Thermogutta sp. TaxID=1962930 RepID=UPI0025DECB63|nr:polysaccharide biosynthesis/export family protein [Thermogutta sp.]
MSRRSSQQRLLSGCVLIASIFAPVSALFGADQLSRLPAVSAHETKHVFPQEDSPRIASARVQPPAPLPLEVLGLRRSAKLELVAQQADSLTEKGYDLAGRGAYFAARAQFRAALVVIAQGLDAEEATSRHVSALSRAWTALSEAEDFLGPPHGLIDQAALSEIIARHETPILKDQTFVQLTALDAFRNYLAYAQDLFAQAQGHEVAGSMALRGLGKLYMAMAEVPHPGIREPLAQAVVFFQAAILVCPENYMAANDLGVLFARGNRWAEAYQVLMYAARIRADDTVLLNLAKVRQKLGTGNAFSGNSFVPNGDTARLEGRTTTDTPAVVWVSPQAVKGTDEPSQFPFGLSPSREPNNSGRGLFGWGIFSSPAKSREFPAAQASWTDDVVANSAPRSEPSQPEGPSLSDSALQPAPERTALSNAVSRAPAWTPSPASPCPRCAVDGSTCDPRHWGGWERARLIAWERYAQGEYVGLARSAHVPEYRLRVDDELEIVYRITREATSKPYRLNVGDQIRVESATDPTLNRDVLIQPDGTITLLLLGQVKATGFTVTQLQQRLEELYRRYYRVPSITVTPILVNSKLEDLRATVDRRYGEGGQAQKVRITPEGTISLPGLGSVRAQGLTLRELQLELNELYRQEVEGIEAIPILVQRAPRYIYVLGEVANPGRFELTGPTTVIQAISMAGGWKPGANLRQIVVFRRGEDWRLMATMLNLEAALHGNKATPCDEIWLSDSDVVILPKSFIQRADDFIELVFTRGIYGVFPLSATINFSKLSTI